MLLRMRGCLVATDRMPALQVFGKKWKIGSDDFVFPYLLSIFSRFSLFLFIVLVMVSYNEKHHCDDYKFLNAYLFIVIGFNTAQCLIEFGVVVISARGTIANPSPRKHIFIYLYLQAIVFLFEFVWDGVGLIWAFNPELDCHHAHPVLILTRVLLLWNFTKSMIIMGYMFVRIGVCQLCCRKLKPPKEIGGVAIAKLNSNVITQTVRQRTWRRRLEYLLCCFNIQGSSEKSAFEEVSLTLADAFTSFRGYVPSDIVAGLALLAVKQSKQNTVINCKPVNFDNQSLSQHICKAQHYMKFALGCYGWSQYCYKKGLGAIGLLCNSRCCQKENDENDQQTDIRGENNCGWNLVALKKITGLQDADIIYISFASEVFCPPFYVAYDHKESAVVVVVRGSLSLKNVLSDLSGHPGLLCTTEKTDFFAHKGIMHKAHALQLKLEGDGILEKAFQKQPDYKLVLVGHSSGAGCASLLSIILHNSYSNLHCFAYAPPGGLVSLPTAVHSRAFITTVVLGNDVVPRLSHQSFELLSEQVLECLENSKLPKYQIFLRSFLNWIGYYIEMGVGNNASQNQPLLSKDEEQDNNSDESEEIIFEETKDQDDKDDRREEVDPITGKIKLKPPSKIPLYLPGRILHIKHAPPELRCCGLLKYRKLQACWVPHSEFSELLVHKKMFKHHMPSTMLSAMTELVQQEGLVIS